MIPRINICSKITQTQIPIPWTDHDWDPTAVHYLKNVFSLNLTVFIYGLRLWYKILTKQFFYYVTELELHSHMNN